MAWFARRFTVHGWLEGMAWFSIRFTVHGWLKVGSARLANRMTV